MRSHAVIEGVTGISTATRARPAHRGGLASQGTGLHSLANNVIHYGQEYNL